MTADVPPTTLDEPLREMGAMWGAGTYERIAARFAPVHDELVAALTPQVGGSWLDVATGTGEVAIRAARAGADVTAIDISAPLLERAQRRVTEERLRVRVELADAQALPFEDGSFDIVSSSFGVIFAPDPEAAAGELARVSRPDGRVGLATWRPKPELGALYERFRTGPADSQPDVWGEPESIARLLGSAFELELQDGTWYLEGESPEEVYELMATSAPPVKALIESLDPERREEFREALLAYWARYSDGGAVREPRHYLLVLGRRRGS